MVEIAAIVRWDAPSRTLRSGRRRGCRGSGTTASVGSRPTNEPQRWRATSPAPASRRRRHRGRRDHRPPTLSSPGTPTDVRRSYTALFTKRHARRRVDQNPQLGIRLVPEQVRFTTSCIRPSPTSLTPYGARLRSGGRFIMALATLRTEQGHVLRTRQHRAARSRQAVIDSLAKLHVQRTGIHRDSAVL